MPRLKYEVEWRVYVHMPWHRPHFKSSKSNFRIGVVYARSETEALRKARAKWGKQYTVSHVVRS